MIYEALIFSHSITPRLQYIVDFLSRYYGHNFRLTSAEEKYIQADDACKINYSYHRLTGGEIFIHPHALLSETYIRPVKVECFTVERNQHSFPAFFRDEGETHFDLFAAIFFLLTRLEEYLPHQKDEYGRYAHQNSVAYKNDFLKLPLINIWLEDFRIMLAEKNPVFNKSKNAFRYIPTYDIDMAWSYRNKGFRRNAGAIMVLFLKARFGKVAHRIRVLRRKVDDPYDAYEWMDELHDEFRLQPLYFFLVAREKGKYDKNIEVSNVEFRQLVQDISSHYASGLHPSWASGDHPSLLGKEKYLLERLTGKPVTQSRQHYIRFNLPATYQRLLKAGITEDHSMGYGSINGFRASVATPFYWYDLKSEEKTNLLIHPFCFMDANSYYEQGLTAEQAREELNQYYHTVKDLEATMITVWHNSFLGTDPRFEGWREVYRDFIAMVNA